MEDKCKEIETLLEQRAKINAETAKLKKKQQEKSPFYIHRYPTGKLALRGTTFDFMYPEKPRYGTIVKGWNINDLLDYGEKFGKELLEFCKQHREEQE